MGNRSIVPFGPQHPVLPEPIHLDLVLEDEMVVEAVPSVGYVHRGLEKLVEKKDFNEYVYIAERICGICSFMHGMGYCETVEHIMGVEIPDRAKYLRTIWSEMSRMHSHMLWLGLLARSEERRVGKSVDLGGRRIIKKSFFQAEDGIRDIKISDWSSDVCSSDLTHLLSALCQTLQLFLFY